MKLNLKTLVLSAALAASALGFTGCEVKREDAKGVTPVVEKVPVDQLFRTSRGYTVYFTNSSEQLIERQISNSEGDGYLDETLVFKDLPSDSRGYAELKTYKLKFGTYSSNVIHIPRDGKISPGMEIIRVGKSNVERPMEELK